jgi:hypothetical protein
MTAPVQWLCQVVEQSAEPLTIPSRPNPIRPADDAGHTVTVQAAKTAPLARIAAMFMSRGAR